MFEPALAIASYNGFNFNSSTETLTFEARPQQDSSGRTITHIIYTLRLRTILNGGSIGVTTDALVNDARNRLLSPGKPLIYSGIGAGGFSINITGVNDVMWGPKPTILSYRPIGAGACELTWQCDVAIPQCFNAAYEGIIEFNYGLTFSIDDSGY